MSRARAGPSCFILLKLCSLNFNRQYIRYTYSDTIFPSGLQLYHLPVIVHSLLAPPLKLSLFPLLLGPLWIAHATGPCSLLHHQRPNPRFELWRHHTRTARGHCRASFRRRDFPISCQKRPRHFIFPILSPSTSSKSR